MHGAAKTAARLGSAESDAKVQSGEVACEASENIWDGGRLRFGLHARVKILHKGKTSPKTRRGS